MCRVDLEAWFKGGQRVDVMGRRMFVRVDGAAGPWLTTLHGFPTCSWDWARMIPRLAATRRVLSVDWLGFGDSDKPRDHAYSIHDQADRLEHIWRMHAIDETALLAHDYGNAVCAELLARRDDGKLATRVTTATILNGSIYTDINRPLFIQKLLMTPLVGAIVTRFVSEREFARNFRGIFGPTHPVDEAELHAHWLAIARHGGNRIYDKLIHHYRDHDLHAVRWEHALEHGALPLRFVWGMADPVSRGAIMDRMRARRQNADIVALDGVGHYPQLEVPDDVAARVL